MVRMACGCAFDPLAIEHKQPNVLFNWSPTGGIGAKRFSYLNRDIPMDKLIIGIRVASEHSKIGNGIGKSAFGTERRFFIQPPEN